LNLNRDILDNYRNYIFIFILAFAVIVLAGVHAAGAQQDKSYRENYSLYAQASQYMDQEKYSQAQELLAKLDADSQANYHVLYMLAVCAEKTGNMAEAADYLQKVRETRPAMLMNQEYLCRYGAVLYQLGEYRRAELYLLQSLKYPDDTGTTQEANKYLAEIAENSRTGGQKKN
jgi:Cytochrome c biogenesis factor